MFKSVFKTSCSGLVSFLFCCICFSDLLAAKINVHVITHSHLDAGWIYDYETCSKVVHHIFTSVFAALQKNPDRKYTVGDTFFFKRWY
jgi:hypothetical protein